MCRQHSFLMEDSGFHFIHLGLCVSSFFCFMTDNFSLVHLGYEKTFCLCESTLTYNASCRFIGQIDCGE